MTLHEQLIEVGRRRLRYGDPESAGALQLTATLAGIAFLERWPWDSFDARVVRACNQAFAAAPFDMPVGLDGPGVPAVIAAVASAAVVDLDDIERRTRAFIAYQHDLGPWASCPDPEVILALIGRIRELKAALNRLIGGHP